MQPADQVGDCPCGSARAYADCCGATHAGRAATSAEQLMRSRYSAYCVGLIDYLVATTLPAQQARLDVAAMEQWSRESTWRGLTVENSVEMTADRAQVTFVARWADPDGSQHQHRERSDFVRREGKWYFIDPNEPIEAGRNTPCSCGSGKKFKRCCAW